MGFADYRYHLRVEGLGPIDWYTNKKSAFKWAQVHANDLGQAVTVVDTKPQRVRPEYVFKPKLGDKNEKR